MKKFALTLCIAGSAIALSACDTTSTGETSEYATPYKDDRTASHEQEAVYKPAPVVERTFKKMQTK